MTDKIIRKLRCAVYTRKSSEEGLEQEFNSLHAQRESCEAFIASQRSEGWVLVPAKYDDGGFSGSNIERPALTQLMADIEAGLIDCVVVYKVDRLSRSLMDFATIVAKFEQHQVSFVSVTQQFNTTTSMGRLTLNILLSFAQFEREIIAERIRDKIAASKKRGKWVGGVPVLGYDVSPKGRRLVVNQEEAEQVRQIFKLYLQHGSLGELTTHLAEQGWTNKRWTTRAGKEVGGMEFNRTTVHKLLRNKTYIGKVVYQNEEYEGEHQAIVDMTTFMAVQERLARQCKPKTTAKAKYPALLKGLLRCAACDCGMSHAGSRKDHKVYRYYLCHKSRERNRPCATPTISAPDIEAIVVDEIAAIGRDPELLNQVLDNARRQAKEDLAQAKATLADAEQHHQSALNTHRREAGKRQACPQTIEDCEREVTEATQALAAAKQAVATAEAGQMDEALAIQALTSFGPIWHALSHDERVQLLKHLIHHVDFHGETGEVAITFHPTGITSLAVYAEQSKEAEEATA